MKHVIKFKDGHIEVFENEQVSDTIVVTGDPDLPRLDAVGEFVRVYCENGLQYLYPVADIHQVISATTPEAEPLLDGYSS